MKNYFDLKRDLDEAKKILEEKKNELDKYFDDISLSAKEVINEINRVVKISEFDEYPKEILGETIVNNIIGYREREKAERKSSERDY